MGEKKIYYRLVPDKEFIENMPFKLLSELIIFDDVIPHAVNSLLRRNKTFSTERRNFLNKGSRRDLDEKTRKMIEEFGHTYFEIFKPIWESEIIQVNQACEFMIHYPQFKKIITSIKVRECGAPDLLGEIPFDEFLNEYVQRKENRKLKYPVKEWY